MMVHLPVVTPAAYCIRIEQTAELHVALVFRYKPDYYCVAPAA